MRDMSRVGVGTAGESTGESLTVRLTSYSILAEPKRYLTTLNMDVKRL